jgi:hypothetical protein
MLLGMRDLPAPISATGPEHRTAPTPQQWTATLAGIFTGQGTTAGPVAAQRSALRSVLLGTAAGAGYGIALRAWMRLVATDPEFSWSGTGYIVGVFAVLGTMAGAASAVRRRGGRRAVLAVRTTGVVLSLGCFVAAGAAMFPTVVPAGLGAARTDWPRRLRAALVLAGVTVAVAVVVSMTELSWARRLVALATYLPLCAVEVAMLTRLYAPSLPRDTLGWSPRAAIVVGVVILVALGALAFTGVARPG